MEPEAGGGSPLEVAESALLDGARLPLVAKHRLRLLAHSLRTLQTIAGRRHGPAPSAEAIVAWAKTQEPLANDPGFRAAFCQQLLTSALLLAEIDNTGTDVLGLELDQLIAWCEQRRDEPTT